MTLSLIKFLNIMMQYSTISIAAVLNEIIEAIGLVVAVSAPVTNKVDPITGSNSHFGSKTLNNAHNPCRMNSKNIFRVRKKSYPFFGLGINMWTVL